MKSNAPGRMVGLPAGALVALLAGLVTAPAEARAGCSHYVLSRADREALAQSPVSRILGESEVSEEGPPSPADPVHPLPCSGPSCSEDPSLPSAPGVEAPRPFKMWACLWTFPALPGPGSRLPSFDPCDGRPSHRGPSVFHPPRPTPSRLIARS